MEEHQMRRPYQESIGNRVLLFVIAPVVIIFSLWFLSREPTKETQPVVQQVTAAERGPTTWTVGNNSYIPLPNPDLKSYDFRTDRTKIMLAEQEFEQKHPQLRVLNYNLDLTVGDSSPRTFLEGIWVHHEPRQ